MMPSIPARFISAKSEASFVNSQVITDKIQERIENGKSPCWNFARRPSAEATAPQQRRAERRVPAQGGRHLRLDHQAVEVKKIIASSTPTPPAENTACRCVKV